MKLATVRVLKNQTSEMLRLAAGGQDVLITSHGRPVAILQGLKEEDLEDYVLSRDPVIRKSLEEADREYRRKGGIPLGEVLRRLRERKGKRHGPVRR